MSQPLHSDSPSASPIQSLPPEILSGILSLVLNAGNTRFDIQVGLHDQHSPPDGPFSSYIGSCLGSVCRTWRDVSLSTPDLWSSIWLDLGDGPDSAQCLERAKIRLERSKSFPLTVTLANMVLFDDEGFVQSRFISCGPRPSEEKHVGWAVLDLILEHAHQIQCLCISSDDGPVESFFTSLMPHFWDRFINLEDLHIDVDSTSYSFIIAEEFNRSPLLHRIGIHSPAAGSPYVPTDHLTHIMLEEVELSNFANILTRCSLLESVDVKVYDARFHEDLSIPKCPRLRTFHVSFVGDDHYFDLDRFKDLVELLDFPSLTSLSLQMPRFDDNAYGNQRRSRVDEEYFSESLVDFVAAFEAFLTRSPNIESFRLVSSYLDDLDVYTLLTQLPQVTSLVIIDTNNSALHGGIPAVTDSLLRELEIGEEVLVPKLRNLRLDLFRYECDSKWTALEEMLENRWNNAVSSRFQSVYLRFETSFVPDLDLERFKRLQAEGLAIRVVYSPSHTVCDRNTLELLGYRAD